jgi:hypothetical protein
MEMWVKKSFLFGQKKTKNYGTSAADTLLDPTDFK